MQFNECLQAKIDELRAVLQKQIVASENPEIVKIHNQLVQMLVSLL